jgi:hypothetical protein
VALQGVVNSSPINLVHDFRPLARSLARSTA